MPGALRRTFSTWRTPGNRGLGAQKSRPVPAPHQPFRPPFPHSITPTLLPVTWHSARREESQYLRRTNPSAHHSSTPLLQHSYRLSPTTLASTTECTCIRISLRQAHLQHPRLHRHRHAQFRRPRLRRRPGRPNQRALPLSIRSTKSTLSIRSTLTQILPATGQGPEHRTEYAFNNAGALETITYSDSTPGVTNTYNRLGRLVTNVCNGITTTFAYNLAGEQLSETFSGGTLDGLSLTNAYDQYLRRTNPSAHHSRTPLLQHSCRSLGAVRSARSE